VSDSIVSSISALAGALLGGGLGIVGTLWAKKYDESRTRVATRRQLVIVLKALHGRFVSAKASASSEIVIDDSAIDVLFRLAFSSDAALSLTPVEGEAVAQAALRSLRVSSAFAEMKDKDAADKSTMPYKEDRSSIVRSAAEDAVLFLEKALMKLST
jgi:hypothetical protein